MDRGKRNAVGDLVAGAAEKSVQGDQRKARRRGGRMRVSRRPKDGVVNTRVPRLPAVLTVPEAAIVLQLSETGVIKSIRNGEIDAIPMGRTFRIPTGKLFKSASRAMH